MRYIYITILLISVSGCANMSPPNHRYEVSIKNAWMMYSENKVDLGPPLPKRAEFIDSSGREEFVEHMTKFVGTRYQREALYALGWFGDRRHAQVVAKALTDEDPEVRRIATISLSRLSGNKFSDSNDALNWWLNNSEVNER